MPTNPSNPNGVVMELMDVDPPKLKAPDVTVDDFFFAISKIKPSVSNADLQK